MKTAILLLVIQISFYSLCYAQSDPDSLPPLFQPSSMNAFKGCLTGTVLGGVVGVVLTTNNSKHIGDETWSQDIYEVGGGLLIGAVTGLIIGKIMEDRNKSKNQMNAWDVDTIEYATLAEEWKPTTSDYTLVLLKF